ncbi:MAG: N-acetylmuramoyl-L-alanine amidase, partial [Candidatus Omnitrophota bacterium]
MSYRLRIIFWGLILSALLIEISGCATRGGRGIVGPEGASFKPSDYKIKRICLDAGHGGKDPGALGRRYGLKEKFVVLDIVRRMKKMLTAEGIEVVTTRDKDVFVPLDKRARVANMAGVDLFLSIHANAHRRRGVSGFEAYYISDKADDAARALSLAKDNIPFPDSYILTEGSGRPRQAAFMRRLPRDVKATVWDLVLTENRIQSVELADYICRVS